MFEGFEKLRGTEAFNRALDFEDVEIIDDKIMTILKDRLNIDKSKIIMVGEQKQISHKYLNR